MNALLDALTAELDQLIALAPRIAFGLIVLAAFVLAGRLSSRGFQRIARPGDREGRTVRLTGRFISIAFGAVGLVLALNILGLTALATSLLATGGILAVVLGFAFREIGENFLAGILLSFSRSFDVGDLIESDGLRGIVRAINLRDVQIRTGDGRDIFIPSAAIFRNPLQNFTRDGLRRGDFTIGVDYGDRVGEVRDLLLQSVSATKGVLTSPKPSVQIAEFADQNVRFDVFFWVNTFDDQHSLASVRSDIMDHAHRSMGEAGITFSSNVSTAVDMSPVRVRVDGDDKSSEQPTG